MLSRDETRAAERATGASQSERFALELEAANDVDLAVSTAATAAFATADDELGMGDSDFAAVMEVARRGPSSSS